MGESQSQLLNALAEVNLLMLSPMLLTTITLMRLQKRGYESLLAYYQKVAPQLNEPLYARTARTVV